MLYLSASSISDYLECPARFKFRREVSEEAETNDHIVFGNVIHAAIEHGKDLEDAVARAKSAWGIYASSSDIFASIIKEPPKNIYLMLSNYYKKMLPQLNIDTTSLVEYKFKYKWNEELTIVGKMDLVSNNSVYDWKTAIKKPSKYDLRSLQFYLYYVLYRRMYGKTPDRVVYGHLQTGSLIPIDILPVLVYNTEQTIERIAAEVAAGLFEYRPAYHCNSCLFKTTCERSLSGE